MRINFILLLYLFVWIVVDYVLAIESLKNWLIISYFLVQRWFDMFSLFFWLVDHLPLEPPSLLAQLLHLLTDKYKYEYGYNSTCSTRPLTSAAVSSCLASSLSRAPSPFSCCSTTRWSTDSQIIPLLRMSRRNVLSQPPPLEVIVSLIHFLIVSLTWWLCAWTECTSWGRHWRGNSGGEPKTVPIREPIESAGNSRMIKMSIEHSTSPLLLILNCWQCINWIETYIQREFLQLCVALDLCNIINSKANHQIHDDDRHDEDEAKEDEGGVGWEGDHLGILVVFLRRLLGVVVLGEDSLKLVLSNHHHHRLQYRVWSRVKCHLEKRKFKCLIWNAMKPPD